MPSATPPDQDGDNPRPRFLTLRDVARELAVSAAQAYALVRTGELPAIKVGGRGQWRIERCQLEACIARAYEQTATSIRAQTRT